MGERFRGTFPVDVQEGATEFEFTQVRRESKRHVHALAAEKVHQDAIADGHTGDLVKKGGGRLFIVLQEFGRQADIFLPGGAVYPAQFSQFVGFVDPLPQVLKWHMVFDFFTFFRHSLPPYQVDLMAFPMTRIYLFYGNWSIETFRKGSAIFPDPANP